METASKILVPIAMAVSPLGCARPPLEVRQEGAVTVIDLQLLGEYPSDVAGVRLIEVSHRQVVWELNGRNDPQLGRITLTVGENSTQPADVRHGAYDVMTPAGMPTFTLAPGTRYVVEAWNNAKAKRTAEFKTPTAKGSGRMPASRAPEPRAQSSLQCFGGFVRAVMQGA